MLLKKTTSRLLGAIAAISFLGMVGNNASANDISIALQHTSNLQQQAASIHHQIEVQFLFSRYAERMCQLTDQIRDSACELEEQLIAGCSPFRARQLTRVINRRTNSLNQIANLAIIRAQRGVDPPVGCTLRFERQLADLCETVRCLQAEVELVTSTRGIHQSIYAPTHQQPIHQQQLHRPVHQPTSGVHLSPQGLSFSTGSVRFFICR